MTSTTKNKECELKWKVNGNHQYGEFMKGKKVPMCKIQQSYLDVKTLDKGTIDALFPDTSPFPWKEIVEVRIRCVETASWKNKSLECEWLLTCKSDGTLERSEYETKISASVASTLLKYKLEHTITLQKIRSLVEYHHSNGEILCFEVDDYIFFGNESSPLCLIELEFDPETYQIQDLKHIAQTIFGDGIEDVTENKQYKNRNLAFIAP
jgi:CYTH domain-containing protein